MEITMPRKKNYKHGFYTPDYPEKFMGTGDAEYRSSYELKLFDFLDHNPNVMAWGSESIAIPYIFELDNSKHRYYPDIIATVKTKDGNVKRLVIEVKPHKQTIPPVKPVRGTQKQLRNFDNEMTMFVLNRNKWEAADKYCKSNNLEFVILTENEIFNLVN